MFYIQPKELYNMEKNDFVMNTKGLQNVIVNIVYSKQICIFNKYFIFVANNFCRKYKKKYLLYLLQLEIICDFYIYK